MKHIYALLTILALSTPAWAQKKIKVLFIGDSYTSVNNLPLTIFNVAKGNGDTLVYDSNTPGGTTLQGQCANATTLSKIAQGGWDYVVLQAQSEEPSFPPSQVQTDTYPYAARLDSLIHAADSCTETVFYMTWGHQNGDPPNCPFYSQICTYTGMQDRLTQSYLEMGQLDHATVAPIGEAWRKIVSQSHPFDMYMSDSTHPSIYGTYLAASVFYEILFQKSVLITSFTTSGIPDSNAVQLRYAAHTTVNDSLSKWLNTGHIPVSSFTSHVIDSLVQFTSTSINGADFTWNFGDGGTGTGTSPYHTYHAPGNYLVTLTVTDHCKTASYQTYVSVIMAPTGINEPNQQSIHIYPNPASSQLYIELGNAYTKGSFIIIANELGQTVKKVTPDSSAISISVSDLPAGVYTMTVAGHSLPVVIAR